MPKAQEIFLANTSKPLYVKTLADGIQVGHRRITTFADETAQVIGPYRPYMALPPVPVLHPYSPNAEVHQNRRDGGITRFPVVLKLNSGPDSDLGASADIGFPHIDKYIVMQSNPWKDVPILFRPHPWLHSTAPYQQAGFNQASRIEFWVSYGKQHFASTGFQDVSTHSGPDDTNVYSPNNMQLSEALGVFGQTHIFTSVCVEHATRRAAITLHVLLNDPDFTLVHHSCALMRSNVSTVLSLLSQMQALPISFDMQRIVNFCSGLVPTFRPYPEYAQFLQDHNKADEAFNPDDIEVPNAKHVLPLTQALREVKKPVITYLMRSGANTNHVPDSCYDFQDDDVLDLMPPQARYVLR